MKNRFGFLLLFSGSIIVILAGFFFAANWIAQEWLVQILAQFFVLTTPEEYIRWLVNSFSNILFIAGVVLLIGAIIWFVGPRHPHRGADIILAVSKIIVALGAAILLIPIVMITLAIIAATVFGMGITPLGGFLAVLTSWFIQLFGLICISIGSYFITKL